MTTDQAQQALGAFRAVGHLSVSQFDEEMWRQISKLPDATELRLIGVSDDDGSRIEIGREFWRYDGNLHVDVLPLMRAHPMVGRLDLVERNGSVMPSLLLDGSEPRDVTVQVLQRAWRAELGTPN